MIITQIYVNMQKSRTSVPEKGIGTIEQKKVKELAAKFIVSPRRSQLNDELII